MNTGWKEIEAKSEQAVAVYSNNFELIDDLKLNEYLILTDNSHVGKVADCFQKTTNGLIKIKYPTINNTYLQSPIKPRNPEQYAAMDLLKNRDIRVKLIRGVYGSGKDYLMLNEAISLVDKDIFEKIVFIRPNVTVKDVPEIGYLKGSLDEKLDWTLGPIYDKVGGRDGVERLKYEGKLESQPLLFIRGRSFENSLVYVTEGQNMTVEIIKLLLSRIGAGSELWINGDTHQTDARVYEKENGVTRMIDVLGGNKLFGYVYLPTTERDEVANLANLFDKE